MDMPKSKQGGDNSSRKFEEVGLNLLRGYTKCFPVQDFIKSDHDDLGDVDINDISEDEIRLNFESIELFNFNYLAVFALLTYLMFSVTTMPTW